MARKASAELPPFEARTAKQAEYYRQIQRFDLTFGIGPAGTGKTHVVTRAAVDGILSGRLDRHVVVRSLIAVEDEDLGALPGDPDEKLAPWVRPIHDELKKLVPADKLRSWPLEAVPIGFIRGRTFEHALVHVTEAQNLTVKQARAIVTRLGAGSKLVIEGDPDQADISGDTLSYLLRVASHLGTPFGTTHFSSDDVVRSDLVKRWVKAFEKEAAAGCAAA